jgi:hypothetical protein
MWQILVPSVVSVLLMSLYLLRMHPQLRHEMEDWVDEDDGREFPPVV